MAEKGLYGYSTPPATVDSHYTSYQALFTALKSSVIPSF